MALHKHTPKQRTAIRKKATTKKAATKRKRK